MLRTCLTFQMHFYRSNDGFSNFKLIHSQKKKTKNKTLFSARCYLSLFKLFEINNEICSFSRLTPIIYKKICWKNKNMLQMNSFYMHMFIVFCCCFSFSLVFFQKKKVCFAQSLHSSLCWISQNGIFFLFYSFWLTVRLLLKQFEKTLRRKKTNWSPFASVIM